MWREHAGPGIVQRETAHVEATGSHLLRHRRPVRGGFTPLPMEDYLTMIYRLSGRCEEPSTTVLATPRVWMLPAVPIRSSVPRRGGRS